MKGIYFVWGLLCFVPCVFSAIGWMILGMLKGTPTIGIAFCMVMFFLSILLGSTIATLIWEKWDKVKELV